MIEYLPILLGTAIFGIQHSGVSSLRVKGWIIDRWGKAGYSKVFTVTSILTFLIAFLATGFSPWLYFFTTPELISPILFLIGIVVMLIGLWIARIAGQVISVSTVADMRTDRTAELVTDGIYSQIRHPLYLATVLIFLALIPLFPFAPVAVFSVSMCVYTIIGAYFEERKLVLHYGEEYLKYREHAGFILPRLH